MYNSMYFQLLERRMLHKINESFISHSYTNPQDHQFLVEFLKRTAQFYAVSYTHFDFLVDLLAIEVPQLFTHKQSGPDHYSEFYTFLQDYVPGCHIEEKLPLILVSYYTLIHICFTYSLACAIALTFSEEARNMNTCLLHG